MRIEHGRCGRRRDRGIAVFVTMGVVLLLSALTMALVMATSTDAHIAGTFRNGLEAAYAADAAVHRALIDLALLPDWTPVLDGTVRSSFVDGLPGGVRRVADGPFVDLDQVRSLADCGHGPPCSDGERDAVTLARPWGVNNPRWQLYAYGPLGALLPSGARPSPCYVVVLVADDSAEQDGNPARDEVSSDSGAGVVRLRAEAFGPGGAHRAVELTVERAEPASPAVRVTRWTAGV